MTALRVLHVDDEPDIREVVEVSLGLDPDLEARSCASGEEALTAAADWPPDIILLDVMMPVMDGPATLARLRNNASTAGIPVVFMTARAQSRELEHFRSLGAAGVIPKPFDPMTLAASVRSYVPCANNGIEALRDGVPQRAIDAFLQRVDNEAAALALHRTTLKTGMAAPATLDEIRDIAHGLAGAGGIFGLSAISDVAAALEKAIVDAPGDAVCVETTVRAIDRLLACIDANRAYRKEPLDICLDA